MSWDYKFSAKARKQLQKLGHEPSRRIVSFLKNHVAGSENPRHIGKSLKGELREYWRYRVDDYRIICRIEDSELIVFVVKVGHRRDIYE